MKYKVGDMVRMLPGNFKTKTLSDKEIAALEKGFILEMVDENYIVLLRDGNKYIIKDEDAITLEGIGDDKGARIEFFDFLKTKGVLKDYLKCYDNTLILGDYYQAICPTRWISNIETDSSKVDWVQIQGEWHAKLVRLLSEDWREWEGDEDSLDYTYASNGYNSWKGRRT